MHGKRGARVDYYRTVTGRARVESHEDPRTGEAVRALRVERVVELLTCRDCWAMPAVQTSLKEARRTGASPQL